MSFERIDTVAIIVMHLVFIFTIEYLQSNVKSLGARIGLRVRISFPQNTSRSEFNDIVIGEYSNHLNNNILTNLYLYTKKHKLSYICIHIL